MEDFVLAVSVADTVVISIAADVGTCACSPAVGNCNEREGAAERKVSC